MLILAGGRAKRLGDAAKDIPKAMIDVGGEPFIAHQMRLLNRERIARAILLTGHLSSQIENFVGDGSQFGIEVTYSGDGSRLLGTGGAVMKALSKVGDEFAIMYGDSYLDIAFAPVYRKFKDSGKMGLLTVLKNCDVWQPSNIKFDSEVTQLIEAYDKEKSSEEMQYIDFGLSIFRKEAFEPFKKKKSFDLSVVFQDLIKRNELIGYEVSQRFYDIGTPEALIETRAYLSRQALWS